MPNSFLAAGDGAISVVAIGLLSSLVLSKNVDAPGAAA
jgi:hypothetical protein